MSTRYKAYFRLKNQPPIAVDSLQHFLAEYHLQYEDRPSYFVIAPDGILEEKLHDHEADWPQFLKEVNELKEAVNASFANDSFYLALGFVPINRETVAILEISESNLEELSYLLKPRHAEILDFLGSLYQTLQAEAMVWGMELSFKEALAFWEGILDKLPERVCTAISNGNPTHFPERSFEWLRRNGGRDFVRGHLHGVTQWFWGLQWPPASVMSPSFETLLN